jgi:capsule polysaccharide export protein KpsE/RkpR
MAKKRNKKMTKKSYKKIAPILSIIVGILILVWSDLLAIAVALFLIIKGILDLAD